MKVIFIYLICAVIAVVSFFQFNQGVVLAHQANRFYEQEQYTQAAQHYLQAVQQGYRHETGMVQLVSALNHSDVLKNKGHAWQALLSSASFDSETLFAIAGSFERVQNWERAADAYDRLIETGHSTDAVLLKRARVAGYAGEWDQAATYLYRLIGEDS